MQKPSEFRHVYDGAFVGILRWPQLDALWEVVRGQPEGWFIYFVNQDLPAEPAGEGDLAHFIEEVDTLLRREHDYDYCGIVYADNRESPRLIKIFDPNNLGASCGSSGQQIPPRWLLCRMPPEPIADDAPTPGNRKRWWQRVFARD